MNRTPDLGVVTAASGDHFDVKQYVWHKYTDNRGVKLTDARGRSVSIRTGDLFGVKEATTKQDRILVLKEPTLVFKVDIPRSERIMESSKEYKGKIKLPTEEAKKTKPTKVKIDLSQEEKPLKGKPSKPVQPNVEMKKIEKKVKQRLAKPNPKGKQKIKIDLQAPEDDDEVPMGHVRFGGRLITPDELEFDDDLSGLDLPIPKHYSSLSATTMYYGSQTANMDWNNFHLIFVTSNIRVAQDYAEGKVAFAGLKHGPIVPTLYQLQINPRKVFDLRKQPCREDYVVIRDSNPDQELPSLRSTGFIMSHTGLPSYGHVRGMRDALVDLGYDCMYVDEGSQGISLAVFQPHVVVDKIKLDKEQQP